MTDRRRVKDNAEILTVRQVREAINRHVTLTRDREGLVTELLLDNDALTTTEENPT